MENRYDIWLASLPYMTGEAYLNIKSKFKSSQDLFETTSGQVDALFYDMDFIPFEKRQDILNEIRKKELQKADEILEKLEGQTGPSPVKIMVIDSDLYPESLRHIFNPPVMLYYRGAISLARNHERNVAMVGSRKASRYGQTTSFDLAKWLGENHVTVVSGMALGIDSCSHRGCLKGNGKTIAVLGSGIDVCYPARHYSLMGEIIEKGLLLSEYGFGESPLKYRFPERNRIISGLCKKLIVVEAGVRSGSLITATLSLEQGKDIYAIPGNINSLFSKGTNKLIKEGATPIIDFGESLIEFFETLEVPMEHNPVDIKEGIVKVALRALEEGENKEALHLYKWIKNKGSLSFDDCMGYTKFSVTQMNECLTILELNGLIKGECGVYSVI